MKYSNIALFQWQKNTIKLAFSVSLNNISPIAGYDPIPILSLFFTQNMNTGNREEGENSQVMC